MEMRLRGKLGAVMEKLKALVVGCLLHLDVARKPKNCVGVLTVSIRVICSTT